MLLSLKVDKLLKRKICKKDIIGCYSFSGGKIVFIQLTKVIVFYITLIIIDMKRFAFEKFFFYFFFFAQVCKTVQIICLWSFFI